MSSPDVVARPDKTAWFTDARFGMFIHWGPYAVSGRGEWVRSDEQMTFEDYEPAVAAFGGEDFDAREWARIAVDAGMKYAVLTAKHHDGYCMWDTAYTTYNSVHQPMGRDVVREYVDAFREAGLKVGLYYSTIDWRHPDYPAFGDEFHPDRENEAFRGREHNFDRYLDFMHAQVEELCAKILLTFPDCTTTDGPLVPPGHPYRQPARDQWRWLRLGRDGEPDGVCRRLRLARAAHPAGWHPA